MKESSQNQNKLPVTGNDTVLSLLNAVRRGDKLEAAAETPPSGENEVQNGLSEGVSVGKAVVSPADEQGSFHDGKNAGNPAEAAVLANEKTENGAASGETASKRDAPGNAQDAQAQKQASDNAKSDADEAENGEAETENGKTLSERAEGADAAVQDNLSDKSGSAQDELLDNNGPEPNEQAVTTGQGSTDNPVPDEAAEKKQRFKCVFAKIAAVVVFAAMLIGPVVWSLVSGSGLYYIYGDDGELAGIVHSDLGPRDAALTVLDLYDEDEIVHAPVGSTGYVSVNRSFPVTITADGKTATVRLVEGSVGDVLSLAGITVSGDDIVTPALDAAVSDGEKIVVKRVTYEERAVHEAVAWQEVTKPSPLISDGSTRVMNSGGERDGEADRVYRDTYVDGELTSSEIISETITKYPWNVVTLKGDSNAPLSSIDGSQFTDVQIVDGVPESYEYVISNGICTAYSFKPGVWGATGMYLFQGFVAVNPNVIPLGSLLYITNRSGTFVYGWAIAADVGEAMMEGRVDIDCFMETYNESCLFGRKTMDIYVVAQLTQEDLEQYAANMPMLRARIPQ